MDTNFLEKVNKASLRFLEPLTPNETYVRIGQEAKKLIEADYSSIFLEKEGRLERIYASAQDLYKIHIKPTGFVHKTFKKNTPFAINSDRAKEANPQIRRMNIQSFVLIPLSYKGKSIGVLSVLSLTKKNISKKELQALKLFGATASLAIRKTQLYDEAQKALRDRDLHIGIEHILEKIYKAGIKFLVPLNTKDTYETIVREAIKLIDARYGSLVLEEDSIFKEVFSTLPIRIIRRKRGFTYRTFKQSKVLVVSDREPDEFKKINPEVIKLGIKSIVFIPLSYRNKSIGVLIVNSEKEEYLTQRESQILKLFGSLASLAIRKSQLYNELTKTLEARDLFIAIAAHEFRTPLTTIMGYAQLLQNKMKNIESLSARWILELSLEVKRLSYMVNELLEISRVKSGQFEYVYKECSLREIARRAVNGSQFNYPEHKIILEDKINGESDIVVADFDKLLQVITNILDNAAKFSFENTKITLKISDKDGNLVLNVIDSGKGIPKKDLPRIFEGFYKGKENYKEGMGLGLLLAKNIMAAHHGSIHVESEIGKGTKVEVQLPRIHT